MSLKQLAQHLDLSVSTVSRALNGYTDISEETRERTLRAAKALGYSPNTLAKRLAEGRTGTVAVVLTPPFDEFIPPMFLAYLQGVDEALRARGMDTLVTMGEEPPDDLLAFRRLVEGKRVDGFIFGRTSKADRRVRYLLKERVPFVAIGQSPGRWVFPFVDVDRYWAARKAVRLLTGLGHERIALVNTGGQFVFSQRALSGYSDALTEAGLPSNEHYIVDAGFTDTSGYTAALKILTEEPRPTAFVGGNDLLAIGCMRALRAQGLVPGRDAAVVSCEDNQPARLVDPPLTALSAPAVEIGRLAVDLLIRAMAGEAPEQLQHIVHPELVERGTHCKRP